MHSRPQMPRARITGAGLAAGAAKRKPERCETERTRAVGKSERTRARRTCGRTCFCGDMRERTRARGDLGTNSARGGIPRSNPGARSKRTRAPASSRTNPSAAAIRTNPRAAVPEPGPSGRASRTEPERCAVRTNPSARHWSELGFSAVARTNPSLVEGPTTRAWLKPKRTRPARTANREVISGRVIDPPTSSRLITTRSARRCGAMIACSCPRGLVFGGLR
jgi:hypothetical protein